MAGTVVVKGFTELQRALKNADKDTKDLVREAEKNVAKPVQLEAQRLAVTEISGLRRTNMKTGAEWALMRIGITQKLIYVAPQQRGKKKGSQKRRKFGPILMDKAMEPALERHSAELQHLLEQAMERMADNFNRGT